MPLTNEFLSTFSTDDKRDTSDPYDLYPTFDELKTVEDPTNLWYVLG